MMATAHVPEALLVRLEQLIERARTAGVQEPTAMTLATVGHDGAPSTRTVLLKHHDTHGFVFYTNTQSRKGQHLAQNPRVSLLFYWQPLMEQVTIEGTVEPVAETEADAYWATRPRISQLGGWASLQSQPLKSREDLDARLAKFEQEFADTDVPRPPHWSGYRVTAHSIEFWMGRTGRMHDRERYVLRDNHWHHELYYP
jgi:pyridoxamine 5'-phosphate oxidase